MFKYKDTDLSELIATDTMSTVANRLYMKNTSSPQWATTTLPYAKITQGVNEVFKTSNTNLTNLAAKPVDASVLTNIPVPTWATAFKVYARSKNGPTGDPGNNAYFHSGQDLAPNTTQYKVGGSGGAGGYGIESYVGDMYSLPQGAKVTGSGNTIILKSQTDQVIYQLTVNDGAKGNRGNDARTGFNAWYGSNGDPGNQGAHGTVEVSAPGVNGVNGIPGKTDTLVSTNQNKTNIYFFKL